MAMTVERKRLVFGIYIYMKQKFISFSVNELSQAGIRERERVTLQSF